MMPLDSRQSNSEPRWTIQYGQSAATGEWRWFVDGPKVTVPHGIEVVPATIAERAYAEGWADCESEPRDVA